MMSPITAAHAGMTLEEPRRPPAQVCAVWQLRRWTRRSPGAASSYHRAYRDEGLATYAGNGLYAGEKRQARGRYPERAGHPHVSGRA